MIVIKKKKKKLSQVLGFIEQEKFNLEHSHPQLPSYSILPSQKVTLSIIPYHFTTHLTSQLLFYYSTH